MISGGSFHPVPATSGTVTNAAKATLPAPPAGGAQLPRRIRITWRSGPGYITFGATVATTDVTVAANQIDLPTTAGSEVFVLGSDQLVLQPASGFTVNYVMEY